MDDVCLEPGRVVFPINMPKHRCESWEYMFHSTCVCMNRMDRHADL